MPYKSEAQRKFFNSPAGKKKLGEEEVEHWNEVSKGKKLPKKADKAIDKAIKAIDAGKEGPEADAEIKKLVQEQIQVLGKAEAIARKLAGYESKFKKYKWSGSQVAYTQSAVRKLQNGIDDAISDLERSLNTM